MGSARGDFLKRGLAILGFIAVWWVLAGLNDVAKWLNPVLLPTPLEVLRAGIDLGKQGVFLGDIGFSLYRASVGFVVAAVTGILLGAVCGYFPRLEQVVGPVIELLRPIPPLAFLPMFIIWFGIGETAKILFIAYSSFFPIFVNTFTGVRYVEPILVRAALSLGADRGKVLRNVIVPYALPYILTGLRLGMGMALFVLVAAELIVAQSGIGFRIQWARQIFRVDLMLFGAFLIGVLGLALNALLVWAERRLLRWKGSPDQAR